jgi:hypothetical protein
MLAGERHGAARPLLLRDPTHLMVECVIEPDMLVDGNDQTALRRKIGIAQGVLRAAGCWHAELCRPPRSCTACWRRHTPAACGWRLRAGCCTPTALLLMWRCPACHGTAGGRRRHEGRSGEERGEFGT